MTLLRDFYNQTHTQQCCFHPLGVYTNQALALLLLPQSGITDASATDQWVSTP